MICPVCHKEIRTMVALCGFKAKCECSGTWGLGTTESEARAALDRDVKEKENKWKSQRE
jgi:hypothetical protein